jgi:hypothetical protein
VGTIFCAVDQLLYNERLFNLNASYSRFRNTKINLTQLFSLSASRQNYLKSIKYFLGQKLWTDMSSMIFWLEATYCRPPQHSYSSGQVQHGATELPINQSNNSEIRTTLLSEKQRVLERSSLILVRMSAALLRTTVRVPSPCPLAILGRCRLHASWFRPVRKKNQKQRNVLVQ